MHNSGISSVQMVDVEGSANIPTVLYYPKSGSPLIGYAARMAAGLSPNALNENFKIELGKTDPTSSAIKPRFETASSVTKTAADLTSDFIHQLLINTQTWLEQQGCVKSPNILLAEPLAMQTGLVESDWLSNYRRNLQRILIGKSFNSIDFLPEPFAVFQYYRYGLRHPRVAERIRHNALVIDFGGGTFDVCVISTTKEGDISRTGRNSIPLAAASIPIGGFSLNGLIAQDIIRKHCSGKEKSKYKKAADAYHRWLKLKNERDLSTFTSWIRNFICHMRETIHAVEDLKLTLCRNVSHWHLDEPIVLTAPIAISENPYIQDSRTINAKYSAAELRSLFESKIWTQELKPTIKTALRRAQEDLQGSPISVVLMSGGSANIGWLRNLLIRDFEDELLNAEILNLPDYQEVVAKGLAVECARRFFTAEGDFSSVTYNRLCLILDCDSSGRKLTRFQTRSEGLPQVSGMPGVLLPSASILGKFIGEQMRWKFRMERPPRKKLEYYFLRSSFDSDDIDNLQNIEQTTLFTPKKCIFDSEMKLQLTVEEDGTARPEFIYKTGRTKEETISVEGHPFS